MPVRMVPDAQYEVVEIQYFILRGKYLDDKRYTEISQAFELLSRGSKFKIRTFYTNHYVAQNMPRIKDPRGFSDFYIVWHYVFKNPYWNRFIVPNYYAVGGVLLLNYGNSPFLVKSYLESAFDAPSEKIKKAGGWKSQQQFMLWLNYSMSLYG